MAFQIREDQGKMKVFKLKSYNPCFFFDPLAISNDESSIEPSLKANKSSVTNMSSSEEAFSLETFGRTSGASMTLSVTGRIEIHRHNIDAKSNYQEFDSQKLPKPLYNCFDSPKVNLFANNDAGALLCIPKDLVEAPQSKLIDPDLFFCSYGLEAKALSDAVSLDMPDINEHTEDGILDRQVSVNPYDSQNISEPFQSPEALRTLNNSEIPSPKNSSFDDINDNEEQIQDEVLIQEHFKGAYESQISQKSFKQEDSGLKQEDFLKNNSASIGPQSQPLDQLELSLQLKKKIFKLIKTRERTNTNNKNKKKVFTIIRTKCAPPSKKKNLYTLIISHIKSILEDWARLEEDQKGLIPVALTEIENLRAEYNRLENLREQGQIDFAARDNLLEKLKLARFNNLKDIFDKIKDYAGFLNDIRLILPEKQTVIAIRTKLAEKQEFQLLFIEIITRFLGCEDIDLDPFKTQNLALTYYIIKSRMEPDNKKKLKDPQILTELLNYFLNDNVGKRKKEYLYTKEDEDMENDLNSKKQKKKRN